MTFAEQLQRLRKKTGMSQVALAEKIGISWRAYQTYERGEREPTRPILIALADFYDLSLDELVCRERGSAPAAESCPDASCNPQRK